jgi:hypothetical protein
MAVCSRDWTPTEDERLKHVMHSSRSRLRPWDEIARLAFPDGSRGNAECLERWNILTKPKSIKGPWSPEEDAELIDLVREHGPEKWVVIAQQLGTRSGKQCRERWHNHLDPSSQSLALSPFCAFELTP